MKVGDRVRVKRIDLRHDPGMSAVYVGMVGTIYEVDKDHIYPYGVALSDDCKVSFLESELELIEEG